MRVLLIQKPDLHLKRALLECDYIVDTAESTVEADQKIHAAEYNLVVLDLELPGRSGLKFVQEWRGSGINAPVLALVSRNAAEEKVKVLNVGADFLVTKPYERGELTAQIRALLRRVQPTENSVLAVFDLEIDVAARSVKRAGQTIKLTRREFALLHFLASNRGKVVSRSMILANLFGGDEPVTSNVVDVHIRSLRVKLDTDSSSPMILTCYGEGYMFRGET